MTKLNDILFPVRKVEFETEFGVSANSDYSHAIVGNVNGVDRVLNVCSDRYELLPNSEVFPKIQSILDQAGVKYDAFYHMINYAKFYAKFIVTDERMKIGRANDFVNLMFEVDHSYNGLCKLSINLSAGYRKVCTNGLTYIARQNEFSMVNKHTETINKTFEMFFNKLADISGITKSLKFQYDSLAEKSVSNYTDRIIEVLNGVGISKGKSDVNLNAVVNAMQTELSPKRSNVTGWKSANDWLVYNAINEGYVYNRNLNSMHSEKRVEKDKKVLEYILAN
jgi:hypothetical protein